MRGSKGQERNAWLSLSAAAEARTDVHAKLLRELEKKAVDINTMTDEASVAPMCLQLWAIAALREADPKQDAEFIKSLYQRTRVCGLLVEKEIIVSDLQSESDLQAAEAKDVDMQVLQRDWAKEDPKARGNGDIPPSSMELSQFQALVLTASVQRELASLGGLLPVENPNVLIAVKAVRSQVDGLLTVSTEAELEEAQRQWDEWKVALQQLLMATRKTAQKLEAQWKRRAADAKTQQKRDAKAVEKREKMAAKKRKIQADMAQLEGDENKTTLMTAFLDPMCGTSEICSMESDVEFKAKVHDIAGSRPWMILKSDLASEMTMPVAECNDPVRKPLIMTVAKFVQDFPKDGNAIRDRSVKAMVPPRSAKLAATLMDTFAGDKD
eukprot:6487282-Amphidinium_carterae.3